jgi:hypothetical protein
LTFSYRFGANPYQMAGDRPTGGALHELSVLSLSAEKRQRARTGADPLRKGRLLAGMLVATAKHGYASDLSGSCARRRR